MPQNLSRNSLLPLVNLFLISLRTPDKDIILHLKFVPPGPANFAANPVVTHTEDLKKGINLPTTISAVVSYDFFGEVSR